MASKLLNLLALASIAIMACSFGATPTTALSVDTHNVVRHLPRSHDAIARRKRASGKRCKHRHSSSSAAPQHTEHAVNKPHAKGHSKPPKGHSKPPKGHSKPPPQGNPSSGTGSNHKGSKRGLAWPNGDDPSLSKYKTDSVSWLYTWSPQCPSHAKKLGFECIPTLWGWNQVDDFKRLVKKGYARTVFGMNEVNEKGQSNIGVSDGIQLWKQYIQPLRSQGYYLVSPSTSSAPSGKKWMQEFFNQCPDCHVDAINVHYYDVFVAGFIEYVKDYHKATGNRKVWVTEFACQSFNNHPQCDYPQTVQYFKGIMDFMDNTDFVEAYSAFGVMHQMQGVNPTNQLMKANGSPTSLGRMYIGA